MICISQVEKKRVMQDSNLRELEVACEENKRGRSITRGKFSYLSHIYGILISEIDNGMFYVPYNKEEDSLEEAKRISDMKNIWVIRQDPYRNEIWVGCRDGVFTAYLVRRR